MKKRVLFLPVAALVITALVVYRLNRPPAPPSTAVAQQLQPCPDFELFDTSSQVVRLSRYLGRHPIAVVFFDGETAADEIPILQRLFARQAELNGAGIVVIGINRALPQVNEQAWKRLSSGQPNRQQRMFLLLSDIDGGVHLRWQVPDLSQLKSRTRLYWIDRAGRIAMSGETPQPVSDLEAEIRRLLGER